jgi:hypothetical protein
MPIPKYDGSPEKEWIGKCMSEMPSGEYDQEQALAICYKQMEMSKIDLAATEGKHKNLPENPADHDVHHGATSDKAKKAVKPKGIGSEEEMAEIDIPFDIIGDNEEKVLDYLPEPKAHEMEDAYLSRCVPCLYPKYFDQTQATALCADKLQRKTTVTNLSKVITKLMKPTKNTFEDNRIKFRAALAVANVRAKGIELKFAEEGGGSYPWDECIADQVKQYGDEETAKKVCGYIKSEYGS